MKKFKKVAAIMMIMIIAITGVFAQSISEVYHGAYEGKVVILHSNDVHGALEGYAKMATLYKYYEKEGAKTIVVDDGDFAQGSPYVSLSKGHNAITMMNAVPYHVVGLGNHEFDYGYDQLMENLKDAKFYALCANVFDKTTQNSILPPYAVFRTNTGANIGIFALETPVTQTKVNPLYLENLYFPVFEDFFKVAQQVTDHLKQNEGADVVICLAHLGVAAEDDPYTSPNLLKYVSGIDLVIDGHSHSVFTEYDGLPIQQTGTKFANIGVVVLDDKTGKIEQHFLQDCAEIADDPEVAALAKKLMDEVDQKYGVKFAESKVSLNGVKAPGNRTMETNNGDLITDAMRWAIVKDASILKVPAEDVIAVTNGGGIRAPIEPGDVTMRDINTVLPFGNTLAVIYVKGSELLEALEASTYCTPDPVGGFPQVAGMSYTIDTTKPYDSNAETYPASTYYGPKSIQRVTINDINGQPYDPDKTYAVITNNFCAAGGDTYYIFKNASDQFDTGIPLDEVVMQFITEELKGVIGEEYSPEACTKRIIIL